MLSVCSPIPSLFFPIIALHSLQILDPKPQARNSAIDSPIFVHYPRRRSLSPALIRRDKHIAAITGANRIYASEGTISAGAAVGKVRARGLIIDRSWHGHKSRPGDTIRRSSRSGRADVEEASTVGAASRWALDCGSSGVAVQMSTRSGCSHCARLLQRSQDSSV